MKKQIVLLILLVSLTGCFSEKTLVVHEYKTKRIFIPGELLEAEPTIVSPSVSDQLTKEDEDKIKAYILELYLRNRTYESRLKIIQKLVDNFNLNLTEPVINDVK